MADPVFNPFSNEEEVLFRDADGNLKVLKGGKVDSWQPTGQAAAAVAAPPALPPPSELDSRVDEVIAGLKLEIADEILRKRMRTIVRSRFKDVRDAIEMQEALQRSVKVGGLGLTPEAAEAAVGVIEEYYQQWSERKRQKQNQSSAVFATNVGAVSVPPAVPPSAALRVEVKQAKLTPLPPTTPPPVAPLPPAPAAQRPRFPSFSSPSSFAKATEDKSREREGERAPIRPTGESEPIRKIPSPIGEPPQSRGEEGREGVSRRLPLPSWERVGERGNVPGGQVRAEIPPISSMPPPMQPAPSRPTAPSPPPPPAPLPPTPNVTASPPPVLAFPVRTDAAAPPPAAPPPPMPQLPAQTPPPSPPAFTPPSAVATPPAPFRPKLVGPLEELQGMTLVDFRRLDSDPGKATQRLREKIALLEQQSFGHKAAAIAAWRRSETFQQYAEIAAAAMTEKKSITGIITARQSAGATSLTIAEFEAIADFNRTLRF